MRLTDFCPYRIEDANEKSFRRKLLKMKIDIDESCKDTL